MNVLTAPILGAYIGKTHSFRRNQTRITARRRTAFHFIRAYFIRRASSKMKIQRVEDGWNLVGKEDGNCRMIWEEKRELEGKEDGCK